MQSRNPSNLKGIDVSSEQGVIDFQKVKASGVQVVYIKATEGIGYVNPYLKQSHDGAVAAGLKVGLYHWFTPHNNDFENPKAQAQYFLNAVKGLSADCKYMLDLEVMEDCTDSGMISTLAKIFLDTLNGLTGKPTVLYTFTNFVAEHLTDILKGYPLWIAEYGVNTPGANHLWNNWIGFQYASNGVVPGISKIVDMDEFTNDILLPVAAPLIVVSPFPGVQFFGSNKVNNYILMLDKQLIAKGYSKYYANGVNGASDDWGPGTQKACQAFQLKQGWTGSDADGIPGAVTWERLFS